MDEKLISRFNERVERRGPDECWPWQGALNERGYGVGWDGSRTRLAHRIAWFVTTRAWPRDCLCHRCDNPRCCNPRHLFEGSRADNLADMRRKGRQAPMPRRDMREEAHPCVKLTRSQVLEILDKAYAGVPHQDLANEFMVTSSNIGAIAGGRSWPNVPRPAGTAPRKAKLNADLVREIRASQESGIAIARRLGVSPSIISEVRRRRTWKHVA